MLDLDKSLAVSTKIGDFLYDNVIANGVIEGQILWGIHKDYVKEWNKRESATTVVGVEYVVKP